MKVSFWTLALVEAWKVKVSPWTLALEKHRPVKVKLSFLVKKIIFLLLKK